MWECRPRTAGDGPVLGIPYLRLMTQAPHSGGWSDNTTENAVLLTAGPAQRGMVQRLRQVHPRRPAGPAQPGMILRRRPQYPARACTPRQRGDEPPRRSPPSPTPGRTRPSEDAPLVATYPCGSVPKTRRSAATLRSSSTRANRAGHRNETGLNRRDPSNRTDDGLPSPRARPCHRRETGTSRTRFTCTIATETDPRWRRGTQHLDHLQ